MAGAELTIEPTAVNAAWSYVDPIPRCEPIRERIAFYPHKVDSIEVSAQNEQIGTDSGAGRS